MSVQIQLRRGSAAAWTAANPILAQGEMGVELDTGKFKIGDGSHHWADLIYGGLVGPQGPQGPGGLAGLNATLPIIYDSGTNTISLQNPIENVIIDGGNT